MPFLLFSWAARVKLDNKTDVNLCSGLWDGGKKSNVLFRPGVNIIHRDFFALNAANPANTCSVLRHISPHSGIPSVLAPKPKFPQA